MKSIALMKLLTDHMPRKVAIAMLVLGASLIAFAVLFFTLGTAHDTAETQNEALKQDLDRTSKSAKQARDDRQFIVDNQEMYEELLHGDRLVPHTRRVATDQLTVLARQRGLTTLGFDLSTAGSRAAATAASQPVSGGYRVQVENLTLKIGAALDTQVYDFLLDLGENFPGSAVVEQFNMERASDLTTDALNQVSRGHESGLVKGEVKVTWRTAQAQEDDKKNANPPPRGAR